MILWSVIFLTLIIILVGVKIRNTFKQCAKKVLECNNFLILVTRNEEKTIEGVVRSIVTKIKNVKGISNLKNLIVVDNESNDQTPKILKRLSREYEFIYVIKKEEYIKEFLNFNNE